MPCLPPHIESPPRRRCLALAAALLAGGARAANPPGFLANFQGLKLVDHEGRPLKTEPLAGRLVLVNFVYTGCSTTCPLQTRALAEVQRQLPAALRTRVRLLSVSLDPLHDTPAVLKDYAQRMGADLSGWTFATGRPQDVERIADALRLYRPGSDARKPEDHATAVWLLDGQGQLRMRYGGNPVDVPRLLRELGALDQLERQGRA